MSFESATKGQRQTDHSDLVVRDDGTVVKIEKALGPKEEIQQFAKLFKDWRMLALL